MRGCKASWAVFPPRGWAHAGSGAFTWFGRLDRLTLLLLLLLLLLLGGPSIPCVRHVQVPCAEAVSTARSYAYFYAIIPLLNEHNPEEWQEEEVPIPHPAKPGFFCPKRESGAIAILLTHPSITSHGHALQDFSFEESGGQKTLLVRSATSTPERFLVEFMVVRINSKRFLAFVPM